MLDEAATWIRQQIRKRQDVVSRAAEITWRPSAFVAQVHSDGTRSLHTAFSFFVSCVVIVLAIEAIFSFVFRTAFSDLIHHSFPVLVVLLAGFAIYSLLKILLTPNVAFTQTLSNTLQIGGAALLCMISLIFVLLTIDFAVSYDAVVNSPCAYRTIICLMSGGSLEQYDAPDLPSSGSLGMSFPFIILVMLATLIHYSRVLAKTLQASMGVARWRSYIAIAITVVVLSPVSLLAINAVYRFLYQGG